MRIIFVCTGNTCRSPMAEAYLKSLGFKDFTVESRGLAVDGSPACENAVLAMRERGIDLTAHRSRPLSIADLSADWFIGLAESHVNALCAVGVDPQKVLLLGGGIADPFGGDLDCYRRCRDQITAAIDELLLDGALTGVRIAPMTADHAAAVAEIETECFSEPWSENALLESLAAGTHFFVALDREDAVLGYVGVSTVLDEGYFTNIAVKKAARGRGVASLLMHRVATLAKSKNLSFVSLEVRASNQTAIRLYDRFGYRQVGLRRNFYRAPVEDAMILTKRFDRENENSEH